MRNSLYKRNCTNACLMSLGIINKELKRTNWRRRANAEGAKASPEFATNAHQVEERQVGRFRWDRP